MDNMLNFTYRKVGDVNMSDKIDLSHIKIFEFDDSYIIYDTKLPNRAQVNDITCLLINLFNGKNTVDDVVQITSSIINSDAYSLVNTFLENMKEKGFIYDETQLNNAIYRNKERKLQMVYLNITSKCNMKCTYCCVDASGGEFIKPIEDLSTNEIINIINKIHKFDPDIEFHIMGGEPFLRKDVTEIIKHLDKLKIPMSITTNGTLLTKDIVQALPKNIDIKVSMDTVNIDLNNKLRGKTIQAIKGLDLLIEYGFKPKLGVTLSKPTLQYLEDTLSYCKNRGVDISIAVFEQFGRGSIHKEFSLSNEEIMHAFNVLKDFYGDYITARNCFNYCKHVIYNKHECNILCGMSQTVLSIASNGDVYPCINLHVDEFKLGNIVSDEVETIIEEQKLDNMRTYVDDIPSCKKCDFKYTCGGGCRASAYWKYHNTKAEKVDCMAMSNMITQDLLNL